MEKSLISHLSVVHRNLKELWIKVGGAGETGTNCEKGKKKENIVIVVVYVFLMFSFFTIYSKVAKCVHCLLFYLII